MNKNTLIQQLLAENESLKQELDILRKRKVNERVASETIARLRKENAELRQKLKAQ